MPNENPPKDAPGGNEQNPPVTSTSPAVSPKVEVKDGKVLVDGKSYVKESDLIAAKEGLQRQIESAQTVHNSAIDKVKLELSTAQTEVAKANVALEEAKKARVTGDISAEEMSKVKKEADDAKAELAKLQPTTLGLRRQLIMATYQIPANSDTAKAMETKTSAQLDALEEALKALHGARGGPGNYLVGGSGGGATPRTDRERARELLNATPYRGVRNAAPPPAAPK
jgi:uncharacterized Zn finger protein